MTDPALGEFLADEAEIQADHAQPALERGEVHARGRHGRRHREAQRHARSRSRSRTPGSASPPRTRRRSSRNSSRLAATAMWRLLCTCTFDVYVLLPSVSDRDIRGDAWHAAPDRRNHHPHRGPRRGVLPDLVRLHQLLRGFGSFRLPSGTPIASLYAVDPAVRRPDRAVHGRAARQRHPQRLRSSRAAGRGPRSFPLVDTTVPTRVGL